MIQYVKHTLKVINTTQKKMVNIMEKKDTKVSGK